jgi:zinc transporter, ZIP family
MEPLTITLIVLALISPMLGSLVGIIKLPSEKVVLHLLSFAAAILLAVSFMELLPEAVHEAGIILTLVGVVLGVFLFHKIIPHIHLSTKGDPIKTSSLLIFTGVALHNLPAGILLGSSILASSEVAMALAIALIVHNLPEGMLVSASYYKATNSRLKALGLGLAIMAPLVIGFLLSFFLLQNVSEVVLGFMMALAAGIIIYISVDELIPAISQKVSKHKTIFSFILGVLFVIVMEALLHVN